MPANFKKFDVKHGISVNGLPFVDENRNVTLNNLTVQGTSTVVDTRTVSQTDPIISIGSAGSTYAAASVTAGTPGRIFFSAEAFDDFALSDSVKFETTGTAPTGLVSGTTYYVKAKDTDVTSSTYRSITLSATQGGSAIPLTSTGAGTLNFTLNPLRDLGQDLGIEFNYVDSTAKKGFFGFDDSTGHFTFLKDTTYAGHDTTSDDGSPAPAFTGTKSGAEFSYAKLEPTSALTSTAAALDIDQTWNGGSNNFKAIEVDITDTASAAASSLLDISVGNDQKLLLRKDGVLSLNTTDQTGVLTLVQDADTQSTTLNLIDGTATWNAAGSTFVGLDLSFTQTAYAAGSQLLSISASANRIFVIDAEGEVVSRSEFTGGGLQTALLVDVTDTSSAANSLLLDLQVGDSSKFSVDKDGDVTAQGGLTIEGDFTANGSGRFDDRVIIQSQINNSGAYADSTEFRSDTSTINAGSSVATTFTSFFKANFSTAKLLVQVKQGTNVHATELLLVHDGTDVYMTEYGTVYNSDILVTFDAVVSGNDIVVQATNTSASVTANAHTTIKSLTTGINA
ncbi:tail fiber [Cyanophage S-TIM66]|nr:tail fiber [Cyanophage S-TIM66]